MSQSRPSGDPVFPSLTVVENGRLTGKGWSWAHHHIEQILDTTGCQDDDRFSAQLRGHRRRGFRPMRDRVGKAGVGLVSVVPMHAGLVSDVPQETRRDGAKPCFGNLVEGAVVVGIEIDDIDVGARRLAGNAMKRVPNGVADEPRPNPTVRQVRLRDPSQDGHHARLERDETGDVGG